MTAKLFLWVVIVVLTLLAGVLYNHWPRHREAGRHSLGLMIDTPHALTIAKG